MYLEALNFIHFGRWIILSKHPWRSPRSQGLPHFVGQPPEETAEGIMLFTSNFDFDWRPYVDTFTETAIDDLGVFWDTMPGWRTPTEIGYREFFEFVDSHSVEHDHYYAAFPALATAHIKSALFVDRAVRSFATQTADLSGNEWGFAFDRLVALLQRDLGTIPPLPDPDTPPAYAEGGGGHLGLTLVAPVPSVLVDTVRKTMRDLEDGLDSPFTPLPGTHFGRLVVIHEVRDRESYTTLASGYILMSVDVDGLAGGQEAWLRTLYRTWSSYGPAGARNLIDEIWGSCWGFDTGLGEDGFVDYMSKVSYDATVPFADYPHASLWDIHRAVTTQHWFSDLVFGESVADMKGAFFDGIVANLPVDPP